MAQEGGRKSPKRVFASPKIGPLILYQIHIFIENGKWAKNVKFLPKPDVLRLGEPVAVFLHGFGSPRRINEGLLTSNDHNSLIRPSNAMISVSTES